MVPNNKTKIIKIWSFIIENKIVERILKFIFIPFKFHSQIINYEVLKLENQTSITFFSWKIRVHVRFHIFKHKSIIYTVVFAHSGILGGAPIWAPHCLFIKLWGTRRCIYICHCMGYLQHYIQPGFCIEVLVHQNPLWALQPKLVIGDINQNSLLWYFLPLSIIFKHAT